MLEGQNIMEYNCDNCDQVAKECYELDNGNFVCQSCYDDAINKAELAYESWRENDMLENQATGN